MNKFIFYLAIFVSLMSLSFANEPVEPIEELIPLNIGNEWTYEYIISDSEKKIDTNIIISNIKDTLIINNELTYTIDLSHESDKKNFLCNRKDGVYEYDTRTNGFNLLFKFPCMVGDSITLEGKVFTTVSTDSIITIKDKSYTTICYQNKYNWNEEIFVYNIYVSKGIGIVKFENYSTNINNERKDLEISELISYKLIPKK